MKFSYYAGGQREQSVDQTGFTVNYTYYPDGALKELTDANGDLIVQYTYDQTGNLVQKDMGNGTETVYTYDGDGNVLSITNYASANGPVNSFDDYTYDALGNVLTDISQDGEWVYNYDADSQLVGAVFTPNSTDPDGLSAQNIQYVYNAAGNRESETVNGVTTTYVVNNVNEYTSSTTDGVSTNYEYDAAGNLIAQTTGSNTTSYTFNQLNELTSASGAGVEANYGYDALGKLVSQTVNDVTTKFQIDPAGLGNVVATFDGTGTLTAHYTYGLGLVSQATSTGTAGYYDFNNIGSTVGITGTTGGYINKYAFLPFGQTTTITAAVSNLFTFVGQFGVMGETGGRFIMGFRTYDSATAQFTSTDPLGLGGGDTNLRRYVGNDPTLFADPVGLDSLPENNNQLPTFDPNGFGITIPNKIDLKFIIIDLPWTEGHINISKPIQSLFGPLFTAEENMRQGVLGKQLAVSINQRLLQKKIMQHAKPPAKVPLPVLFEDL